MDIILIGAGRLATQLALALREKGRHRILSVYSRTLTSACALAQKVNAEATNDITSLPSHADAFIMAVKDDALPTLAVQLASHLSEDSNAASPVFHTAGSIDMDVLATIPHHGVIYPIQTFSKERPVDFAQIPFFIEASDAETLTVARTIASSVSSNVECLDSLRRRQLHLAAVFACNFTNHCYTLAADILERNGLDFSVILPLITETASKVATMHPREAQTGPAVRYDKTVIEHQRQMLANNPLTQQIYQLMSESIHEHS